MDSRNTKRARSPANQNKRSKFENSNKSKSHIRLPAKSISITLIVNKGKVTLYQDNI